MTLRKITEIVVHHTAGSLTDTVDDIIKHHKFVNGWRACGYHRLYDPKSKRTYTTDRFIDNDPYLDDFEIGAGVYGYNQTTVHYSIIGYYHPPVNNRLDEQDIEVISNDLAILVDRYKPTNELMIVGHRDVGPSACPGDYIYDLLPTFRTKINEKLNS
jgi:hypothetical protein